MTEEQRAKDRARQRAYYAKHSVRIRAMVRARQALRRDEIRAYQRAWTRADRRRRPELALLNSTKCRAKRDEIEWALTVDDIVIPAVCPVLGIPIVPGAGNRKANTPSVDSVDNDKGYTTDNIRVISYRANILKRDMTLEEAKLLVANWWAR